jgi:hypothetical protein
MPSKDIVKLRAAQRRYKERNRDAINKRKRAAYHANPKKYQEFSKVYRRNNPEKVRPRWNEYQRRRRKMLRDEMIVAYGSACDCCGENELCFLQLDHVNGNGRKHREQFHGLSTELFGALKREGWPKDGYRLLCANCNWGRERNGGICPHQQRASDQ